ncbi:MULTISPECIES: hypothetical protein [unclassified Campylobacter]|uniref:hypothetical protein n=1 Tax=unclassified Campylobacter TaxID=2593542 RepID=UPI001BDA25EF|nr:MULTISPECIES: hypothetical protein [unclassified Campylobacter]MBT0880150.1 hypothetical protein [Campylobacter sp. 2018MI27]MBT0884785.1 hypothetical protein [Campylobacter sp. 2018MI10]
MEEGLLHLILKGATIQDFTVAGVLGGMLIYQIYVNQKKLEKIEQLSQEMVTLLTILSERVK